jgi:hypothetical protein
MEKLIRSKEHLGAGIPRLTAASRLSEASRAKQLRNLVRASWLKMNPGSTEVPWNHPEEVALFDLLAMTMRADLDFAKLLSNREKTPGVNHNKRPSKWLRSLPTYAKAPNVERSSAEAATVSRVSHSSEFSVDFQLEMKGH